MMLFLAAVGIALAVGAVGWLERCAREAAEADWQARHDARNAALDEYFRKLESR